MGKKINAGVGLAVSLLLVGCVSNSPEVRRTQVVTFPEDALVFYNGQELGSSPTMITLPQDENGYLLGRSVVEAIPAEEYSRLQAALKVFEPGTRRDRVPDRILLDLTGYQSTNFVVEMLENPEAPPPVRKRGIPFTPRSKPTQVVGID